jgi:hypothetical protein
MREPKEVIYSVSENTRRPIGTKQPLTVSLSDVNKDTHSTGLNAVSGPNKKGKFVPFNLMKYMKEW